MALDTVYGPEFPKSLVSDSKSRVSRSMTRIGLGLYVQGSTKLGLRIGLVVMAPVAIDLELVLYFRDFIGEMESQGVSICVVTQIFTAVRRC